MKKFLLFIIALSCSIIAIAQQNGNAYLFSYFKNNGEDGLHLAYSYDGFIWKSLKNDQAVLKPNVGKDKLMRDPCIIRGADGYFHMVWTVSWNEKGIGYSRSKDLINWEEQRYLPVMEHEADARNTWAPEVTYDPSSKKYLIYWSTTIKGKFPETASTAENAYNHRIYSVTTSDFKSFSKTALLYEPGFNVIDASIVADQKKFIMFLKDETREPAQKNIKIAYADQLGGPYTAAGKPITGKYWAEGPTILRKGKEWIVYFDKYTEKKYGAVSSEDLLNWRDISDKISFPEGTRHGSVIEITTKELKKLMSQ